MSPEVNQASLHPGSTNWLDFISSLRSEEFIVFLSQRFSCDTSNCIGQLEHYISEALITFELIEAEQLGNKKLLEVGAGPGLLAAYLELSGIDIISIEPSDSWFDAFTEYFQLDKRRRLNLMIEQLTRNIHGCFDLIYSNNVLEHVDNYADCISALVRVLGPNGRMVHNTPNYFVPFEPHFCIPLVPGFPRFTRFLIPGHWRNSALWKSLNFVTVFQSQRCAKDNGCTIELVPNLLSKQFRRLLIDKEFVKRHRYLYWTARIFSAAGILRLLDFIPPMFLTPMVVHWQKQS